MSSAGAGGGRGFRWRLVAWDLALALLLAASAWTVWYATADGIGIAQDSTEYIGAARTLVANGSLMTLRNADDLRPGLVPLTHFPPLPSLLYAEGYWFGADPATAARWVHVLLFPCSVWVVWLCARAVTRSRGAALAVGALFACGLTMVRLNTVACSEPFFFPLAFGSLYALARYLERGGTRWLHTAACLAAIACLARYVGLVVVGVGALGVLAWGGGSIGQRSKVALVFLVIALTPLAGWFVRNRVVTHSSADRQMMYHPIPAWQARGAAEAVAHWVAPQTQTRGRWTLGGAVAVALLAAGGVVLRSGREGGAADDPPRGNTLCLLLGLFAIAYIGFILVVELFLDPTTNLDDRILSPVYVALLLLAAALCDWAVWAIEGVPLAQRMVPGGFIAAALAVVAAQAWASVEWVRDCHRQSYFFASRFGLHSPAGSYASNHPTAIETVCYSNGPYAIWYATGHPAAALPVKFFRFTSRPNARYQDDLKAWVGRMRREGGLVIYFDAIDYMAEYPTLAELREALRQGVNKLEDGWAAYGS